MRFKLTILSMLLCIGLSAQITDTGVLRSYINANVLPNGNRQITGQQMNTIFNGYLNIMPSYRTTRAVDTLYKINDSTIGFKINGSTRSFEFTGVGTSGGAGSYAWVDITGKPTTIAGYGITDFNSLGDARWSLIAHTHAFSSLTSKPTTLSGYGITDAESLTNKAIDFGVLNHTKYPSTLAVANYVTGLGYGDIFTSGSYTNPSWIISLPWSKITSTPTTLSGYGITDAVPAARTITINGVTYDLSANRSWTVSGGGGGGSSTIDWDSIFNTPTTIAGYGITDFNSLGDARWSLLAHSHTFASLTSKPTTISGYGITDFNSLGDARWSLLAHDHTFASLTSKPTTIAGYGITDFNSLGDARWELLANKALDFTTLNNTLYPTTQAVANYLAAQGYLTSIATNSITDAMLAQMAGLSVKGRASNSTGNAADITAGTDHHVLRRNGTSIAFGTLNAAAFNASYSNGYIASTDASGNVTWIANSGGGGTATGNYGNIQWKGAAGTFQGGNYLKWDSVPQTLAITGIISQSLSGTAVNALTFGDTTQLVRSRLIMANGRGNYQMRVNLKADNTLDSTAMQGLAFAVDPFTTGAFNFLRAAPSTAAQTTLFSIASTGATGVAFSATDFLTLGTTNATGRLVLQGSTNTGFTLKENTTARWSLATYSSGRFTFYSETAAAEAMGIFSNRDAYFNTSLNVGSAAATAASVALGVTSTTKGFLAPPMTTTQRDAISSPATGLQIYNTTLNCINTYNGVNWTGSTIVSSAGTLTIAHGNFYSFTGTTTTWTLPAISATVTGIMNKIVIKNRGSGAITLNSNSGSTIYTTSAVGTLNIAAGSTVTLYPDGTYFTN